MSWLYLIGLSIGLVGMVVLDARFRLFFWRAPARAALVLVLGVAFFLLWDAVGVGFGVFFPGSATIDMGAMIAPGIAVEEPFFLALLCYLTMNAYGALTLRASRSGPGR